MGTRLVELHEAPRLFHHIQPEDVICDTIAGNYWFLSAIAVVAEYPGWIQSMFARTTRLSPEGLYSLRFFNPGRQQFLWVTTDDHVPTLSHKPAWAGISCEGAI